jgi:hypothetical protein
MVSSSFSRAVRAATGFGVDILGDVVVDVFGLRVWLVWVSGWSEVREEVAKGECDLVFCWCLGQECEMRVK